LRKNLSDLLEGLLSSQGICLDIASAWYAATDNVIRAMEVGIRILPMPAADSRCSQSSSSADDCVEPHQRH
jgi:hypothetical protein